MSQLRSPSRWTWTLPVLATVLVAACDNALEGINTQGTWGFVTVSAQKSATGAHFADAEGLFFNGNLSAVPNSDVLGDTCADGIFNEGNNLFGVTYLDAGASVSTTLGGVPSLLERTTTAQGLTYLPPGGPIPFTPGDSIVVDVSGASGGFPAGEIRAKTAEAFAFPPDIPIPAGTEAIHLNWTAPQDPRSAMVVSLRYGTTTSPNVLSRHVFCQFTDDGVDSIPFRWHQNWSTAPGARAVFATRLRTNYVSVGDGNLGVISTYQVPTPPRP